MASDIMSDYGLEKLRAEILQEKQMKEMLEQSSAEIQATVDDLEKRFDNIHDEGNEWKTRFETQEEMNEQLQKQIQILQDRVEEGRRNLKDATKSQRYRDAKQLEELADPTPQKIAAMEREQQLLINQLRDLEWRLDQESKAYHKANEERKQSILEINSTKGTINELRSRQKEQLNNIQDVQNVNRSREFSNSQDNQKTTDAKQGSIKKTVVIKTLPSID